MAFLIPLAFALALAPAVLADCDAQYDSNCTETDFGTRAGIGFVIFAIVFCLIFAAGLARRRRAARMQQAFRAQGVGAPSTGPVLTGTAWSQHVAGGPALPPTAYSGGYAPAYMAPPAGPPPALEEQYPAPPQYEGKVPEYSTSYAPPAGPPPGTPKYEV